MCKVIHILHEAFLFRIASQPDSILAQGIHVAVCSYPYKITFFKKNKKQPSVHAPSPK